MPDVPTGLGERGAALYQRFACADVALNALAVEAARSADRLDELDNIIQGKGVLNLMQFRLRELPDLEAENPTCTVEVQFQSVLAEARQQQANFNQLMGRLLALQAPATQAGTTTSGQPAAAGAQRADNVTPLQAARSAASRR